jgi:hypothetical protein
MKAEADLSNNSVSQMTRGVTVRAYARPAPRRLAGYAGRWADQE